MEQVRIGVIGVGYWGPNLIRNFVELSGSDLVIVSDLKEDRLTHIKKLYPQIQTTNDYNDLFKMGLDAVVVATPPATHHCIAKEALEHGLNVMVEKPLTMNSQDAEELVALSHIHDRVLMVGHTFEFNAAVHSLKQLIESGELGKLYYIDAARLNLGLFQRHSNVIWDLAPHDISILSYVLGREPIAVMAHGMPCVIDGVYDVAYINLIYPDNLLAHIHVSWLDPCKVRRVTAVGSKKMVVYNDIESLEKIKIYDKGVDALEYTDTFGDFQLSYRYGDILIPNIRFVEPLRQECQHFLDCIVNHTIPCSSGENGLKVVKVLEAAQKSLVNHSHEEVIQW
jgi:predicted dehydrogenase